MGMTIAEKIVARAAGLPEVHANEIHTVELDYLMSNDGTTHLTIDMYNNLKNPRIKDVSKLVWIVLDRGPQRALRQPQDGCLTEKNARFRQRKRHHLL